jgi:hypothetical protein
VDYKLTKELKDAGFPQEKQNGWLETGGPDLKRAYFPTLSELIEACGGPFERMGIEDERWYAIASRGGVQWSQSNCSTPEEAVARLWLALKKVERPIAPQLGD